jgi:DNA-binding response OmpR family regulator
MKQISPVKIVIVSAFNSLKDRQAASEAGADDYLEKPITSEIL